MRLLCAVEAPRFLHSVLQSTKCSKSLPSNSARLSAIEVAPSAFGLCYSMQQSSSNSADQGIFLLFFFFLLVYFAGLFC